MTTLASQPARPLTDVDEAYRLLARRLERIVRSGIAGCGSEALVEEACQFAWGRLLDHRERIDRERTLSWLAKTAVREALKLRRHQRRQLSLDAAIERAGDDALATSGGPETLVERRERLSALSALPRRQQRLLWLRALGLSYAEIASHTGDSVRTVERQLLLARRRLRAVAG